MRGKLLGLRFVLADLTSAFIAFDPHGWRGVACSMYRSLPLAGVTTFNQTVRRYCILLLTWKKLQHIEDYYYKQSRLIRRY